MNNVELARRSLNGVWVGDCIGNLGTLYNACDILKALEKSEIDGISINKIKGSIQYSDDTEECVVLYNHLLVNDGIVNQDNLAKEFATRYYTRDPDGEIYGYGLMTRKVLKEIYFGTPWNEANKTQRKIEGPSYVDRMVSTVAQGGNIKDVITDLQHEYKKQGLTKPDKVGSCGNGSAMRVAPLGAFLFETVKVIEEAKKASETTHCHPEGIAGSISVAIAASCVAHIIDMEIKPSDFDLLNIVWIHTPEGEVKNGLKRAMDLPFGTPLMKAIEVLGNGTHVTCQDTVPLCIWLAAKALKLYPIDKMYEEIIIETSKAFGDVDTNCAIVGGIIGIISPPPDKWVKYCVPMEGVFGDMIEYINNTEVEDLVDDLEVHENKRLTILGGLPKNVVYTAEERELITRAIKEQNLKDREGKTEFHEEFTINKDEMAQAVEECRIKKEEALENAKLHLEKRFTELYKSKI